MSDQNSQQELSLKNAITNCRDFLQNGINGDDHILAMSLHYILKIVEKERIDNKKAQLWDELADKIGACYHDSEGNLLPECEGGDLIEIGEIAAKAFGCL